ncbi:RTA1 domain protein [Penicillium angulare]|uniref:RTA1 domain protein n=1 Tax=Penicillium angulare TaxID=116970 RepID=UPI00254079AA|nr:RTA1 domain protein [Penicillium angulare]KAJ5263775.1 RTA1 domain protein [Penicillium angulare]
MSDAYIDYLPNLSANAFFAALFGLIFMLQLGLGVWYRTWPHMIAMLPGLLLEILGYVGRVLLHNNPFDFNNFLLYLICLTLGPAFFSAAIYICLGKIVIIYGENISRFRPRTYTTIFVSCDLLSLILQAVGGALASQGQDGDTSTSDTGVNIMIAGLAFQVFSLLIFMVLASEFALRVRNSPKSENDDFTSLRQSSKWKMFIFCLALATITIFIRSVFRVAELQGGFSSPLANNEVDLMVLEATMVSIACIAFTVAHPAIIAGRTWSSL